MFFLSHKARTGSVLGAKVLGELEKNLPLILAGVAAAAIGVYVLNKQQR